MIEMEYTGPLKDRIVLADGQYKGYNFWIISYGTHPCAYVEIPKGHPYYGKCDGDAFDLPIDVHGGITYGDYGLHTIVDTDKFLLGWDYNHFDDYSNMNSVVFCDTGKRWTTEEILEEVKSVIKQLIEKEDVKMTWEELKEEAKKMGAKIYISPYGDNFERIDYLNCCFSNDGYVSASDNRDDIYNIINLSSDRTPDQMLAIMKALQ